MAAQTAHNKKEIIKALEKSLGIVTTACKAANVPRRTFYMWKEEDENFAKEVNDISEIALDYAESKLHTRIEKGDTTAIIFYLKTKGKKRGYIERNEMDISGGVSKIIFEDADKSKN